MADRRIRWSPTAVRDLSGIRSFTLQSRGTRSAAEIIARLRRATQILRELPRIGRKDPDRPIRQLTAVHPFVIVYRIEGDTGGPDDRLGDVEIVQIWHGSQDRSEEADSDTDPLT